MYNMQNDTAAKAPSQPTLTDRLNKVADGLTHQCERIELVLSRINGTPPAGAVRGGEVAQIRPLTPLVSVVDSLENIYQRLSELANGIDRIA